ncbi:hydroxyacylglutathione hydrolase-like protein-like [Plakobranchus ocellatus]|uniref:Hydroxyacylglutathione hydrolase-like protein-like n=1 Tax=Plakobranchus ocellatus TaxID=259542 RepID=A0AAV4C9Z8_9GAST|nr:hydroxyacylglutathione hydrolase-like protein-like [Plakobranchus ocellatus]
MATQADVVITDPVARKRYDHKIACIGVDPYKIKSEEWIKEVEEYPLIAYGDIFNYLVLETSAYTQESFKVYKSLGVYNQAYNGWVWNVGVYRPKATNTVVVAGKVNHSQQLSNKALSPWIHVEMDGSVKSAHCDCMAAEHPSAAKNSITERCLKVYCGHEYTVTNLKFATTVESDNAAVKARLDLAEKQRGNGEPTIPSTIKDELAFNPFMRVKEASVQNHTGESDPVKAMGVLRSKKDAFRPK